MRKYLILFFIAITVNANSQLLPICEDYSGFNFNAGNNPIPYPLPIDIDYHYLPEPCLNYGTGVTLPIYTPQYKDLIFEDDFNESYLNPSNWITYNHATGNLNGDGDDVPAYVSYTLAPSDAPNDYILENGILKLCANEINPVQNLRPAPWDPESSDPGDGGINLREYKFSGPEIYSLRNFKHGLFEIRCKIPSLNGTWPAFWLYQTKGYQRTEIDVFEFSNNEDHKWQMTYHDWHFDTGQGIKHLLSDLSYNDDIFTNEWHTYGILWDEYRLIWMLDAVPFFEIYHYYKEDDYDVCELLEDAFKDKKPIRSCDELKSAAFFDEQIYINYGFPEDFSKLIAGINVQNFSGDLYPNVSDESNELLFPTCLEIDWIRVYNIKSCSQTFNLSLCNDEALPNNIEAHNTIILGGNGCSLGVYDKDPGGQDLSVQKVNVFAGDKIIIKPGFTVNRRANFNAQIKDCDDADLRNVYYDDTIEESKNLIDFPKKIKPNNKDSFSIFPNPAEKSFTISCSKESKITILNIDGQIIFETRSKLIELYLDLSSGIYLCRIENADGISTQKIVIL